MSRRNTAEAAMSIYLILALLVALPVALTAALMPTMGVWGLLLGLGTSLIGLEILEWLGRDN